MTKSLSARLIAALDRPEIPKHVQREVHNAVVGPNSEDPPSYGWDTLYSSVAHYLRLLKSNKGRVHENLRPSVDAYRDTVAWIAHKIKEADKSAPVPQHLTRWQEWVSAEKRREHIDEVAEAYTSLPDHRGPRIVPFAPSALRAASLLRTETLLSATRAARAAWVGTGNPYDPRATTHLGAVVVVATYQAEKAILNVRRRLTNHQQHPYEEPVKTNWHHYCDAETRSHVRILKENPGNLCFDFTPYAAYYTGE